MVSETHGFVRLRGLRIENALVGVYPHEHTAPQPIVVDVELWAAIKPAARSERLADTVDYEAVSRVVREITLSRHFPLIESLCETLATGLLDRFTIDRVSIEVHKPSALHPGAVSVAIERSR